MKDDDAYEAEKALLKAFDKGIEVRQQSTVDDYLDSILINVPEDGVPMKPGKKFDAGKPDYTLLPFKALEEVVEVLGFGAIKYGRDNWQNVERQRYVAAAFRHLIEIAKGNEVDDESGKSHAAHLSCCALFLGAIK